MSQTEQNPTSAESTESTEDPTELKPYVKPQQVGMIQITESVDEIVAKFKKFEEIKSKILSDEDYYTIKAKGNRPETRALGKTGLYKLGVAFNLDTIILQETRITEDEEPNYIGYKTMVQCRAPNGRVTQDVGFCDNTKLDREGESEHVIRAMATTRAKERAYITMIGAPEKDKPSDATKPNEQTPTTFCKCSGGPSTKGDGKCNNCGEYSELWWKNHHG